MQVFRLRTRYMLVYVHSKIDDQVSSALAPPSMDAGLALVPDWGDEDVLARPEGSQNFAVPTELHDSLLRAAIR